MFTPSGLRVIDCESLSLDNGDSRIDFMTQLYGCSGSGMIYVEH